MCVFVTTCTMHNAYVAPVVFGLLFFCRYTSMFYFYHFIIHITKNELFFFSVFVLVWFMVIVNRKYCIVETLGVCAWQTLMQTHTRIFTCMRFQNKTKNNFCLSIVENTRSQISYECALNKHEQALPHTSLFGVEFRFSKMVWFSAFFIVCCFFQKKK